MCLLLNIVEITPYLSGLCIDGVGGMWGESHKLSSVLQVSEIHVWLISPSNEDIPVFSLARFLAFCVIVLVLKSFLHLNGIYFVFCPSVWLVLSPAVSSSWGYLISMASSLKKHHQSGLCLCNCFLSSAFQFKSLLTTLLILSAHKCDESEMSVPLAQTPSLPEVSPVPSESALSTVFSARH